MDSGRFGRFWLELHVVVAGSRPGYRPEGVTTNLVDVTTTVVRQVSFERTDTPFEHMFLNHSNM